MDKLLVFLGIAGILVSGFFLAGQFGFLENDLLGLSLDKGFVQVVIGGAIAGFGFIRFHRLIGWISIVLGALILIPGLGVIPWSIIPVWLAPWLLAALGIRSLVIGSLSEDHVAG
jgi:hypothetical protein